MSPVKSTRTNTLYSLAVKKIVSPHFSQARNLGGVSTLAALATFGRRITIDHDLPGTPYFYEVYEITCSCSSFTQWSASILPVTR